MSSKSKYNLYIDDEIFEGFCALADEQKVPRGRMFEMLYDQYIHNELIKERNKNESAVQMKLLREQINSFASQSEMLIQMANTLAVKFNFNQLINTNINESGMVSDAKKFVAAQRHSEILKHQTQNNDILNN
ncbi:hypothetical protein [Latilactobacillus graminis]|uniref:Uncharacterized protein n=1 Tax=Latilactobacillus graminis DSM 20719 TaxID=1423752 RepID=A0AA89I2V1_9LACO|nr:hypothetical protein [Latilactobacillus graminis]KRM23584.1 hypothetical protein FC90_GL000157 [Latilactobacillus graminis DSM 20719]